MTRPSAFRQGDVTRALRAARAAGIEVKTIEIDPASGRIIITTTSANETVSVERNRVALENWKPS